MEEAEQSPEGSEPQATAHQPNVLSLAVFIMALLKQDSKKMKQQLKAISKANRHLACALLTTEVDGWTPAHACALRGSKKLMKAVIRTGVAVNCTMGQPEGLPAGCTLLHVAANRKDKKIVNFLLHQGANVHAEDSNRLTALDYATRLGNKEMARLLISWGASTTPSTTTTTTNTNTSLSNTNYANDSIDRNFYNVNNSGGADAQISHGALRDAASVTYNSSNGSGLSDEQVKASHGRGRSPVKRSGGKVKGQEARQEAGDVTQQHESTLYRHNPHYYLQQRRQHHHHHHHHHHPHHHELQQQKENDFSNSIDYLQTPDRKYANVTDAMDTTTRQMKPPTLEPSASSTEPTLTHTGQHDLHQATEESKVKQPGESTNYRNSSNPLKKASRVLRPSSLFPSPKSSRRKRSPHHLEVETRRSRSQQRDASPDMERPSIIVDHCGDADVTSTSTTHSSHSHLNDSVLQNQHQRHQAEKQQQQQQQQQYLQKPHNLPRLLPSKKRSRLYSSTPCLLDDDDKTTPPGASTTKSDHDVIKGKHHALSGLRGVLERGSRVLTGMRRFWSSERLLEQNHNAGTGGSHGHGPHDDHRPAEVAKSCSSRSGGKKVCSKAVQPAGAHKAPSPGGMTDESGLQSPKSERGSASHVVSS